MLRGDKSGSFPTPPVTAATPHAAVVARVGLSFDEWYRRDVDVVWRYLHRMGVSPAAIDDAVQDVFVIAYRRIDTFAGESGRAWLIGIARRIAARYRRGEQRTARRHEALESEPMLASRWTDDLDDEVSRRALRERIVEFLAELDDDKRDVFAGHLAGLRAPEIAAALGTKLNTVYTRLRRAQLAFVRTFGSEAMVDDEPMPRPAKQRVLLLVFARLPHDAAVVATASFGASPWAMLGLATVMLGAQPSIHQDRPVAEIVEPAAMTRDAPTPVLASAVVQPPLSRTDRDPPPTPEAQKVGAHKVSPRTRLPPSPKAPPAVSPAPPPPPSRDALADEVALVHAIREAIGRDDLAAARAALGRHRREFPDGALRREVDRLAVGLGSERIAQQTETTGATPASSPRSSP